MPLFAFPEVVSPAMQDFLKLGFSAGSLIVTLYFWFVRINRERVSVGLYPDRGFEGTLQPDGLGVWTGRVFLVNRSILPTAIVVAKAELWWEGRWLAGQAYPTEGSELPWNLPPSQVFARGLCAVFNLGPETPRERVYANQRIRFTFTTVERGQVREVVETVLDSALAA